MKNCVLFLLALTFLTVTNGLIAQGTAFTYQGQLQSGGSPANGFYDFTFSLYDNSSANPPQLGATLTDTKVGVTNGLFTVTLDFGSVFAGNATWMAVAVRTNIPGTSFTALNPLQELTPAPYAVYAPSAGTAASAESVAGSNIMGTIAAAQLPAGVAMLNGGNAFNGNQTFTGGNVGIGYGASPAPVYPQEALFINSDNPIGAIIGMNGTTSGGHYFEIVAAGTGAATTAGSLGIFDYSAGTYRLSINGSGNVGIGTTTPATTLDVAGNIHASGTFSGNGGGLTNLSAAQLTGFTAATPPASGYPILNMVYIVPGTFVMGAPTSDPDYQSDETQHVVTLTNGFWMGQHPVTQGEYLAVMGNNPSSFPGDLTRPVETVAWSDATNFCYVLTQNEQSAGRLPAGWVYRLPTESEWEYCCRAQTTSRYYFGNDPGDGTSLTNYAWYSVNSGHTTQPVGQFPPNAWGLVDMAGNVFEWCQDWYGAYPTANVSYNPQGAASGSVRVLRGGSWYTAAYYCRSADRYYYYPTLVNDFYGFRVVLAPGQ